MDEQTIITTTGTFTQRDVGAKVHIAFGDFKVVSVASSGQAQIVPWTWKDTLKALPGHLYRKVVWAIAKRLT